MGCSLWWLHSIWVIRTSTKAAEDGLVGPCRLLLSLLDPPRCFIPAAEVVHQQKTFPSGRDGSVRVDALCQSLQRHPGGGLLSARCQYRPSHCISPSDRRFAISSHSVSLLFQTNTLALLSTVTIRRNGFIGYTLASGLQCNGWSCENLTLRSFYIQLEERRKKVRRYDTTRPWGSTERPSETKSWER